MTKIDPPKVILITGCSSGFGLLLAKRFAEYGERVIASMRDLEKQAPLQSAVNEIGVEVDVQSLDVTDKNSIAQTMTYIAEEYGYVDVLINNAGYGLGGAFEDTTDEEFRAQMETNFFGVLNVTRAAIPFLRQRPEARIINMSSISGFSSSPCFGAYNASKWALEGWSESLRYELMSFGIDVCLVRPGSYKTEIFYKNKKVVKKFEDPDSPYFALNMHLKTILEKQLDDNHKDPEEVADLVAKLVYRKNPPFRTIPDLEGNVLYLLRRLLPFRLYSTILKYALLPRENHHR